jgi:hypothetical protein
MSSLDNNNLEDECSLAKGKMCMIALLPGWFSRLFDYTSFGRLPAADERFEIDMVF